MGPQFSADLTTALCFRANFLRRWIGLSAARKKDDFSWKGPSASRRPDTFDPKPPHVLNGRAGGANDTRFKFPLFSFAPCSGGEQRLHSSLRATNRPDAGRPGDPAQMFRGLQGGQVQEIRDDRFWVGCALQVRVSVPLVWSSAAELVSKRVPFFCAFQLYVFCFPVRFPLGPRWLVGFVGFGFVGFVFFVGFFGFVGFVFFVGFVGFGKEGDLRLNYQL